MKKMILCTSLLFFVLGCVSVHSMPQSSASVDFNNSAEGRTGWSKYEEVFYLNGVGGRTAYLAAKAGLSDAGFSIKKASYEKLFAIGEHGMTAYDWNVVAGVYLQPEEKGCRVKILVQGSKDVGFWGDMTEKSWPQVIFKGMREYIYLQSQIDSPDKEIFQ